MLPNSALPGVVVSTGPGWLLSSGLPTAGLKLVTIITLEGYYGDQGLFSLLTC